MTIACQLFETLWITVVFYALDAWFS